MTEEEWLLERIAYISRDTKNQTWVSWHPTWLWRCKITRRLERWLPIRWFGYWGPCLVLLLLCGCASTKRRYDVVHAMNPCVRHIDIDWSKCKHNYCDRVYIEPEMCVSAK